LFPIAAVGKGGVFGINAEYLYVSDSPKVEWLLEETIGIVHSEHIIPIAPFLIGLIAILYWSDNKDNKIIADWYNKGHKRLKLSSVPYVGVSFILAGLLTNLLDLILFGSITNCLVTGAGLSANLGDIYALMGAAIISLTAIYQALFLSTEKLKSLFYRDDVKDDASKVKLFFMRIRKKLLFLQRVARRFI
jgi:hypothetical protein